MFLPLHFFGTGEEIFRRVGVNSSLNVWWNLLVKMSDSGLLFTVSASVLVTFWVIFYISYCFSFERLYLSKNLSIFSRFSILVAYSLVKVLVPKPTACKTPPKAFYLEEEEREGKKGKKKRGKRKKRRMRRKGRKRNKRKEKKGGRKEGREGGRFH